MTVWQIPNFVLFYSPFIVFFASNSISMELSACWGFFLLFSQVNTVINCGYIIKMFCWSPRVKTIKMQQINCRPSTLSKEPNNEFEEKTTFNSTKLDERLFTMVSIKDNIYDKSMQCRKNYNRLHMTLKWSTHLALSSHPVASHHPNNNGSRY